ncbi:MAG: SRPBCC family protein [Jatrophihabitans sp.]|uniref:SRPBCC family protein n=1 Tax=Jatrophihabitans sp. TaxID=1932789 RepID=UPI00390E2E5E
MAPFVVVRDTPLPVEAAWRRIVDWAAHGRYVPLTRIEVRTPPPNGLATVFSARTGVGRFGFDDPMEVVEWEPPHDGSAGHCRLLKRGRVMTGWAELSVEPNRTGSRVIWREVAVPAWAPAFSAGLFALAGRLLFGRVLRGLLAT